MSAGKIVLIVVGSLVGLFILLGACGAVLSSAASSGSGSVPAVPSSGEQPTTIKVGEVANLNGLEVSVTAPKSGEDALGPTYCTTVTYVNNSNEDQSFNTFDWTLRDTDGVVVSSGFVGSDNILGSGNLVPGGKKTGDVCFDKQGNGTPAAVIYDQGPFGEQITFETK